MAKCRLDLSHPHFQNFIRKFKDDPEFEHGLKTAKSRIEENHASCNRVVQPFQNDKYKDCYDKVWKYDWAPAGARGSTRKSWRLVVIVPDPTKQPYELIAGAVYSKAGTTQLSPKELAAIFMGIMSPTLEIAASAEADQDQFRHIQESEQVIRSICMTCCETIAVSDVDTVSNAEAEHQCPGPPS